LTQQTHSLGEFFPFLDARLYPSHLQQARILLQHREGKEKTLAKVATAPAIINDLKKICEIFENIKDYLLRSLKPLAFPYAI
jgi:hypothetical protein